MKESVGFWPSLESYTWKIIGRLSPALPWLGIGLVVLVITTSAREANRSLVSVRGLVDATTRAAQLGDYTLAKSLYNKQYATESNEQVMGVMSELEELVFPEREVQREIVRYEELLFSHPGHRDIYLALARLYEQIDMTEQSEIYYNLARELDPNNSVFSE